MLDLKSLTAALPVFTEQLLLKILQRAPRRPNDVAPLALVEKRHIGFIDHPSVHHPDAISHLIPSFHLLDDLLHGGLVLTIASKNLVAQGNPLSDHQQSNAQVLTIGMPVP